jgi:hypothetical protein
MLSRALHWCEVNAMWRCRIVGLLRQIFGGRKKMSSIAVMDYSSAEGLHAQVIHGPDKCMLPCI